MEENEAFSTNGGLKMDGLEVENGKSYRIDMEYMDDLEFTSIFGNFRMNKCDGNEGTGHFVGVILRIW